MKSRPSIRRSPRASARTFLGVEQLEDRWLPSTITFTSQGKDDLLLRLNGQNVELFDNNKNMVIQSQNVHGLTAIQITHASGLPDKLTIDFSVGGIFAGPHGPVPIKFNGTTNTDTLVIKGTSSADTITLATGKVTVDGEVTSFTGVTQLTIDTVANTVGGGADTVTETGNNVGTLLEVDAGAETDGDTFSLNITGNFEDTLNVHGFLHVTGQVMKTTPTSPDGNFEGHWTVKGSSTIDDLSVGGDLSGTVMTGDITMLMVTGTVSGVVAGTGSGTLTTGDVGAVSDTGMIMFEDITNLAVTNNMSGAIDVTQTPDSTGTLGTLTVGGSTADGTINATNIGTITAGAASPASPVFNITERGVLRELLATRADNGQSATGVVFNYVYEGLSSPTKPPIPQLTVKVISNNNSVPFDLSLTTSTADKFNLAQLSAVGKSFIRDVAIEGDLLSGGIHLPQDTLGCVAAQGNVIAGSVQTVSVQAVAFGSITESGVTIPAESAKKGDAAALLAPGTATVLANGTFYVPFAEGRPVALFLDTGPGIFDVNDVLFTDQITDNLSVTAVVTAVSGRITSTGANTSAILLQGDGGSIQTALPILQANPNDKTQFAINSTGRLGDLTLSSSNGIGNVVATSIFGSINTSGPIWGTIQTISGDLGSGTSTINTSQGITGRIISRGRLVSSISSQKAFTGVIAAQGDMVGGFLSNGQFTGEVVVLGNILGNIQAKSGLAGRIAAANILGSILVSGNVEATGVVVSKGGISFISAGAIKGILAAEGTITIGGTSNISSALLIVQNASGKNLTTIEAIFLPNFGTYPDLTGLNTIVGNLLALHVGKDGFLTIGP
jgi:hypothetical protein